MLISSQIVFVVTRLVILHLNLTDVVHFFRRIEYSKGHGITGIDENGKVCGTCLSWMIHSVAGKYKDIVLLKPIYRITAALIVELFWKVDLI